MKKIPENRKFFNATHVTRRARNTLYCEGLQIFILDLKFSKKIIFKSRMYAVVYFSFSGSLFRPTLDLLWGVGSVNAITWRMMEEWGRRGIKTFPCRVSQEMMGRLILGKIMKLSKGML